MADKGDIEARIKALPPLAASAVVARAAMRLFPLLSARRERSSAFYYWPAIEQRSHAFAILRCYQISILCGRVPEIDVSQAARAANEAGHAAIGLNDEREDSDDALSRFV